MAATTPQGSIVITGANESLGSAVVAKTTSSRELATNYHGIYAVRDPSAAPALRHALHQQRESNSHLHEILPVNLDSFDSVRALARDINERVSKGDIPAIRALVLNARYLEHEQQTWVEGGLDTTWVVNCLSQWLLTLLLLQSMDRESGRVVVFGSHIHDPYEKFNEGVMGGYFADEKWKTIIGDSTEPIARGT